MFCSVSFTHIHRQFYSRICFGPLPDRHRLFPRSAPRWKEAAFLLNAMAALPRKSDPDGAASLPWQTIALARGSASRECGKMTLRRFSFGSAAEVLDDDAGEEGDGVEVGFGFGDGYDFAIVGCTCDLEGVANEADSLVAV